MDLAKKREYLAQHVLSISRHEDEDANVRKAILEQTVELIRQEQDAIDARVAERIAELAGAKAEGEKPSGKVR